MAAANISTPTCSGSRHRRLLRAPVAIAIAWLMIQSLGAQPAPVSAPVLESTEIEVNVGAMPKSERAALTWITKAARTAELLDPADGRK
jgi:hypothetical protein